MEGTLPAMVEALSDTFPSIWGPVKHVDGKHLLCSVKNKVPSSISQRYIHIKYRKLAVDV